MAEVHATIVCLQGPTLRPVVAGLLEVDAHVLYQLGEGAHRFVAAIIDSSKVELTMTTMGAISIPAPRHVPELTRRKGLDV